MKDFHSFNKYLSSTYCEHHKLFALSLYLEEEKDGCYKNSVTSDDYNALKRKNKQGALPEEGWARQDTLLYSVIRRPGI